MVKFLFLFVVINLIQLRSVCRLHFRTGMSEDSEVIVGNEYIIDNWLECHKTTWAHSEICLECSDRWMMCPKPHLRRDLRFQGRHVHKGCQYWSTSYDTVDVYWCTACFVSVRELGESPGLLCLCHSQGNSDLVIRLGRVPTWSKFSTVQGGFDRAPMEIQTWYVGQWRKGPT